MIPIVFASMPEDKETEFEKLYYRYRRLMIAVAIRILDGNYHDAEDAVIDAFLSISKKFDTVSKLSSDEQRRYVCQAAKNKAINLYRKNVRMQECEETIPETDTVYIEKEFDNICNESSPSDIEKCLMNLRDIYKDVLYMRYIEDYTVAEIAAELEINIETVKKRIARGKSEIVKQLRKAGKTS